MSSSSNIAKEEFATRNSSFQYYSRFITACWTNICFVQWDIGFHLRLSQVARFCIHKTTPYYHDSHLHRSQNEWVVAPTDCCIATRLLSERTTASGACHRSVWCVRVQIQRLLSERIMGPRACISVVLDNRELFSILKYKP